MSDEKVTVVATLRDDGKTLEFDEKVPVRPGRVSVTMQAVGVPEPPKPSVLEVLDRIHREQQERGYKGMTEQEMAAVIAEIRGDEGYKERWRQIWSQTTSPPPTKESP
jgi:hypothetical protein